jgi:hypothetical protein
MKVVAFLTEYTVVHRIIRHLELTFAAEKPPPAFGPPWGQEYHVSAPREPPRGGIDVSQFPTLTRTLSGTYEVARAIG